MLKSYPFPTKTVAKMWQTQNVCLYTIVVFWRIRHLGQTELHTPRYTHFGKQSFLLGAFLGTGIILDDSRGPRRASTHPCVCEQLLGSIVSIASVRVRIRPTESKNKPKAHSWSKYTTKTCAQYDEGILVIWRVENPLKSWVFMDLIQTPLPPTPPPLKQCLNKQRLNSLTLNTL